MAKSKTFPFIPFLILAASIGIALAVFAWAGTYARMWADDYCYSAVAQDHEVLDSAWYWYRNDGNRFSAILAVEAIDRFGPYIVAWLPSLVLIAWVMASWFLLHQITKSIFVASNALWSLLAALSLVFFSVLMLPSLQESLYWRMGMLHYTLPLLLLTLFAGLLVMLWPFVRSNSKLCWIVSLALAPIALLAAGFSETYAAFQASALSMAILFNLWQRKRAVWAMLLPGLIGTLAAIVLMALSPSNQWRQELMPPPSSLAELVFFTLRFTVDFYISTLSSLPLPSAVFLAVSFGLGAVAYTLLRHAPRPRRLAAWMLLAFAAGFVLVAAAIAPRAYAGLQYPAERALSVALYGLLLGLGSGMLLAGSLLCSVLRPEARSWRIAVALLLLAAAAYIPTTLDYPLTEVQGLQRRAARWDSRHAYILEASRNGAQNITVQDVVIVSGLEDLRRDPQHWVNSCVARYYDLTSIVETP